MFKVTVRSKGKRLPIPKLDGPSKVKVGFPSGEVAGDIVNIAIWNNYGTEHIPERPFLDNAMRDNRSKYKQALAVSAKRLLLGTTNLRTVMSKLGIVAQGDVQTEITNLDSPANAPSTIAQKGSSNPLIDDGIMRGAVTWKVDE